MRRLRHHGDAGLAFEGQHKRRDVRAEPIAMVWLHSSEAALASGSDRQRRTEIPHQDGGDRLTVRTIKYTLTPTLDARVLRAS
jgi:hypothetical protein